MKHIEPSATFYSWVMNNHWHTNYRAYQEGETTFHYFIRPHAAYDPVEAAKFGSRLPSRSSWRTLLGAICRWPRDCR